MATLVPGEKARMYALGGLARGGATRGGYVSGLAFISIDGIHIGNAGEDDDAGVLIRSLAITDALFERANQCVLTINGGAAPVIGKPVRVTIGSKNATEPLFAGPIVDTTQIFALQMPQYPQWQVTATDPTWQLGFTRVTARYQSLSATTIAEALVASAAANGFTATAIQAALPFIDEFTVTNEAIPDALTRLAKRIGAYWFVDYNKRVHFFLDEVDIAPAPLTLDHASLAEPSFRRDGSGIITRCASEGGGANALAEIRPGETIIPVETASWYPATGGRVTSGPQRLTYASAVTGGGGTLIGPGVTPPAAPTLNPLAGGAITPGVHQWAYTWLTTQGETKPSLVATATTGPLANPTQPPENFSNYVGGGTNLTNGEYRYKLTWALEDYLTSQTLPTAYVPQVYTGAGGAKGFQFQVRGSANPAVKWINVYRTLAAGSVYHFVQRIANSGDVLHFVIDVMPDSTANTTPTEPTVSTAVVQRVDVTVPIGPLGPSAAGPVTQRKVYRTAAGGATLKLLATLADNTTTLYSDVLADAGLGADAPAVDTSGLIQGEGQIRPGDSTIVVANAVVFAAAGGWALIGNGDQVVRYTGVTGGALVGIPATGPGALTATVVYSTTITVAPQLVGVATVTVPIKKGDAVNVLVILDNLPAQATLAASLGGDGVVEAFIQDGRLSEVETRARAQATLDLSSVPLDVVRYRCRDLRTRAGRTITVGPPPMPIPAGTYRIQTVTIANFRPKPTQYPTFTVEASNRRYSFEDLLRRIARD